MQQHRKTQIDEIPLPSVGLVIHQHLFTASYKGNPITLTATEFDLLVFLDEQADRVVPREEFHSRFWKDGAAGVRTVDTFLSRLRSKLQAVGHPGIASVRKRGYRLLESTNFEK